VIKTIKTAFANKHSAGCIRYLVSVRRTFALAIIGVFLLLTADGCLLSTVFAEIKMRVLLLDGKNFNVPPKDEKFTRLGDNNGDLLMGGIKYSGTLEVWRGGKGLYIINEVPLEEYIKGVVSAEIKETWDIEALKAQAVVARTYAIYQVNNSGKDVPFHLTSTVLSQVYKGASPSAAVAMAVMATKGEILTYEGQPIVAFYHSTSGGMTEDAGEVFQKSLPYLKPVQTNCELSPYYMWEKVIPVGEIEKALNIKGITDIKIDSLTGSGRVKELKIFVDKVLDPVVILAPELRRKIGWERLPSTLITAIARNNGSFVFEGRGYGHGVGMCQWSALQMAKDGKTYKEILEFFYPGTILQKYENR
jgi:stage II sporulation protein D